MTETVNASQKKAVIHHRSVVEARKGNTGSSRFIQTSENEKRKEEGKMVHFMYDLASNPKECT